MFGRDVSRGTWGAAALGAVLAIVLAFGGLQTVDRAAADPGARSVPAVAGGVLRAAPAPLEVTKPKLAGTAKVGKTLRVLVTRPGAVKPQLSYEWLRDGKRIGGATESRYALTGRDKGHRISIRVTASRAGYETLVQTTAQSSRVAAGTFKVSKPVLSGSSRVGGKLRAKVQRTGVVKPVLRYSWYRDGKRISGAKNSFYRLKSADRGHRIKVRVAATKYGYAKQVKHSSSKKVRPKAIDDAASTQVVVNKKRPLRPKSYVPKDLVRPKGIENTNGQPVRSVTAKALRKMQAAAKRDGLDFRILSGYRSYDYQRALYNGYVARDGRASADLYSARPGHSEHQTGLAVDLGGWDGCGLGECFGGTATGKWLAKNGPKYGFILRYPKGYTHITGYAYEPWHFRYVGPTVAKKMQQQKIRTLEEYHGLKAARTY